MGDLGKFIAAKGFKKLPKVQKIAKSGHTDYRLLFIGSSSFRSVDNWHLLSIRLYHDVAVCKDGRHHGRAEDGVDENPDGDSPDRVERGEQEEGVVGVEPANDNLTLKMGRARHLFRLFLSFLLIPITNTVCLGFEPEAASEKVV